MGALLLTDNAFFCLKSQLTKHYSGLTAECDVRQEKESNAMNKIVLALTLTMAVTLVGCSTVSSKKQSHQKSKPDVKTVLLQCNKASTSTGYSFVTGKPTSRREADINLYFDGDDCSQGVVFGSDDEEGYIFQIGHKPWSELSLDDLPQVDTKSVIGFLPMTKDKEGLAFWVKARNDRYALVRIKSITPSSYSELSSGSTAEIVLEWTWGRTGEKGN